MRTNTALLSLIFVCFTASCGIEREPADVLAVSRDSISVAVIGQSGSAQLPVSETPRRQASVSGRSTVSEPGAAATELLPDLDTVQGVFHETSSSISSGEKAGTLATSPFEHSAPHRVEPFPLVLNRTVQRYVKEYLDHSEGLTRSFSRSAPYLTQMRKLLEQHEVPPDFVYLAFAESGFSKHGAGPWQLTQSTARRYGLHINSYVDERRDPIKSTQAAAEYLATLHDQVGDWRLAVVGWNTGEASIQRFIECKGADYERMANSLPRRTRALLNRFMAVAFIANHAEEYGIQSVGYSEPVLHDKLTVRGGTALAHAAKMAHTTVDVIRMLNPALLRDRVPLSHKSYELRVPHYRQTAANKF
jgi:membrane-bound lytic murein transglycosylase D